MANKNVYAIDLENYLKMANNLKIRKKGIRVVREKLRLSRRQLGISTETTMEDTYKFLSEFDTVRLEMIERIEGSSLLTNEVIAKEIRKAGFASPEEFIAAAKKELVGEKDHEALKRVLMRGEDTRKAAKENGYSNVRFDPDGFHPMGRIEESEIGQSINVYSVKQLVKSFR
jgi:hypothetical protein